MKLFRTALAESELEYNHRHTSLCAFARFRVTDLPPDLEKFKDRCVYGLTWTTTPWTLVANQALAYSHESVYSIAEDAQGNVNIVAKDLLESVSMKIGQMKTLIEIEGMQILAQFTAQ